MAIRSSEKGEGGLARIGDWFMRDRARALREEITRPWHRGRHTPEAEVGRWVGLGLALGSALLGAGLAVYSSLRSR